MKFRDHLRSANGLFVFNKTGIMATPVSTGLITRTESPVFSRNISNSGGMFLEVTETLPVTVEGNNSFYK